jgi:hypothetical protein
MYSDAQKQSQASCYSAAGFVLQGHSDLETEATALARIYQLDPIGVSRDIDFHIQIERQKGVVVAVTSHQCWSCDVTNSRRADC